MRRILVLLILAVAVPVLFFAGVYGWRGQAHLNGPAELRSFVGSRADGLRVLNFAFENHLLDPSWSFELEGSPELFNAVVASHGLAAATDSNAGMPGPMRAPTWLKPEGLGAGAGYYEAMKGSDVWRLWVSKDGRRAFFVVINF